MKKVVLSAFVLVLLSTAVVVSFVGPAVAEGTIYIRANGLVEGTDKIVSVDNITYTLTDNIFNQSIVVERDNIVVDGSTHTVQGTGAHESKGIDLSARKNVTVQNMEIREFHFGIYLFESSNNTIYGNKITNNSNIGIILEGCARGASNSISGNNITNNRFYGVVISNSSYNNISGNQITNSSVFGIELVCSQSNTMRSNTIRGNNITKNQYGISMHRNFNNTLSENVLSENRYSFDVSGSVSDDFYHRIHVSNLVDGKPVYYLINQTDLVINSAAYLQVGYLALIHCSNITVEGQTLTGNGQGLLLCDTDNSRITGNNMANNKAGVWLISSNNNTISRNDITNNDVFGVVLESSSKNVIFENDIRSSYDGIIFSACSNNRLYCNTIKNNEVGIDLLMDRGIIYHNNFINNTDQFWSHGFINTWDDGYPSGGNYWSDYSGVDANMDGIGDSSYEIDSMNVDHYPLMGMFSDFPVTLEEETYHVTTVCNSTISVFEFDQVNSIIRFNVTGEEGIGFCRVFIPHDLMEPPYTVTIDGLAPLYVNYTLYDNGTNRWIYFTYQHSTHGVVIVPEFPTWTSMLLILIVFTVAIAIYKRRLLKTPIH